MTIPPVLVVAFNRPERLQAVIDRLREVRPARVYVAVDGPREDRPTEVDQVRATRAEVRGIDWPCQVETLFQEQNLGCGRGVSTAVQWLFDREEAGIILEDDILPDPTFFPFCAELLERYLRDSRVWAVSGCNLVPPQEIESNASYRFSAFPHIWGWATWRRAWSNYSFEAVGWRRRLPAGRLWEAVGQSPLGFAYWTAIFDTMAKGQVDTWDYQAVLTAFSTRGLTATTNVNLVENVGFGDASTHTQVRPNYLRPVERMPSSLDHPSQVERDRRSDAWTLRNVFEATPSGLAAQAWRHMRRMAASR